MAESKCARGHLYDSSKHASCPYCNSQNVSVNFENPVSEIGVTEPLNGYGGAVGFQPDTINATQPLNPTVPVNVPEEIRGTVTIGGITVGPIEAVAGWLVCVEGRNKGKDYRLVARNNTVGRSSRNDVCISEDETISSENQLNINYDRRGNCFVVWTGAGIKNTNYLNGKAVYSETVLEPYDVLEVGKTKLIFVPFCGEKFQWAES